MRRPSGRDPLGKVAVAATGHAVPDEDAHLLEHLPDTRDGVRRIAGAVGGIERPAGEDEGAGREAAPARTAEHADLHARGRIAEQRDGAGRDRRRDGGVTHPSHGMNNVVPTTPRQPPPAAAEVARADQTARG